MQHHLLGVDTGRIDAEPDAEVVKLLDDRALPHLLERRLWDIRWYAQCRHLHRLFFVSKESILFASFILAFIESTKKYETRGYYFFFDEKGGAIKSIVEVIIYSKDYLFWSFNSYFEYCFKEKFG